MLKNILPQGDYTMSFKNVQLQLPIDTGIIIQNGSLVFLIEEIVNSLDCSILENREKSNRGRKPKLSPRQLLSIHLLAYSEGIYSSRKIAERLSRDTHYMYLARNETISHTIINNFRKRLKDGVMEDLFFQFIKYLYHYKEVQLESIYIDGTKIEANANKYTFVWKKTILKNEAKLQVKVKKLIDKINETLNVHFVYDEASKVSVEWMHQIAQYLKTYMMLHKIEYKTGKGNRKSPIQRYIEELEDFIIRQSNYDEAQIILENRNSYSKTDTSATFMRMKDDHMKNGQLKPGYNIQIGVEGEYVIGVDVFNHPNDINTFIPFVSKLHDAYQMTFKNFIADAGYASEKNFSYMDSIASNYYIPFQSYYKEQTRTFKKDISKRQNMRYDADKDVFICANNRELVYVKTVQDKKDPEYTIHKKVYRSKDCTGCPLRSKCMPFSKKESTSKEITFSEAFEKQKEKALANIQSEIGIQYRVNRSIQAEGFFGILKEDYNFRRFLLRGTEKVQLEMLLLSFAFNLRKLHKKRTLGKVGTLTQHAVKSA